MHLGKLDFIKATNIELGDRRREDYGDIEDLAQSISERGLIHPIAVQSDDGNPPYRLAAGGRRFMACILLGMEDIACRIYDHPLTELELRSIELLENIDRKDLSFVEECRLKKDIHDLQVEIHGEKISTSPDADGWSKRDTAGLLHKSIGGTVEDIKLAEAIISMPQLELDKCKNKREAMKVLGKTEETLIRHELAKRADEVLDKSDRKLANYYFVGDFLEKVKDLPDKVFDLVEMDPPYGIKLQSIKKGNLSYKSHHGDSYNEIGADVYMNFINDSLKECYRVMNDHSWLIMWFGPEPWFEPIFNTIIDVGFKCRRLTAIWKKGNSPGQCLQPSIYLESSIENFFYAYKGDANIVKQGRSCVFDFSAILPNSKVHPTERPIELMEEILSTFTWEGSRILVPFAGSGNTLIAADNLKMFPIGFDLSSDYKDGFTTKLMERR